MKRRILSLLVLVAAWSLAMPVQAKVRIGLTGGVQLVEMNFNADVLKSRNRVGFFGGPTVVFSLPVSPLSVDAAALYGQRELTFDGHAFTQQCILFPAHLRLGASFMGNAGAWIFAGPQFCYHLGRSTEQWTDDQGRQCQLVMQENTLFFDLGLALRLGRIEATVTYNLPLGKAGDFSWQSLGQQLQTETWERARTRTNVWRLAVTYYF